VPSGSTTLPLHSTTLPLHSTTLPLHSTWITGGDELTGGERFD
jgi:hypothetical protein